MDRDILADDVPIPDAGLGMLACVLLIRRCNANYGVRVNDVVRADKSWALNENVGHQMGTRADFDPRTDDAIGSQLRGRINTRSRIDDRGWMNRHQASAGSVTGNSAGASRSASLHITSASATTNPLT